jgi:hypothetical protein
MHVACEVEGSAAVNQHPINVATAFSGDPTSTFEKSPEICLFPLKMQYRAVIPVSSDVNAQYASRVFE